MIVSLERLVKLRDSNSLSLYGLKEDFQSIKAMFSCQSHHFVSPILLFIALEPWVATLAACEVLVPAIAAHTVALLALATVTA